MCDLAILREEWFRNPEWWFNPTKEDDAYLTTRYGHLLDETQNPTSNSIAEIILYDQLPRHVYRCEHAKHIIEYFLQKALSISQSLMKRLDGLSDEEYVFALLPFRHSNDVNMIHEVINCTWSRIRTHGSSSILKRFLKATYDRCPKRGCLLEYGLEHETFEWNAPKFHDVLEFCPFQLMQRDIGLTKKTPCYIAVRQFLQKIQTRPLILSISGGVDSMVCATLFKHFGVPLKCVHINYCNRALCEEEFVVSWCQAMNIPISVRRLQEIQRGACIACELRDTYETYTRDVRYETYRVVWESHCSLDTPPHVVLGHNKDDCFENVLTNIAQKQKTDNLDGMDVVSCASGICFLRPLLDVSKSDIYDFARYVGIPYLQDSTPSWSQRGMIRDTVRPTLEKWHPCFVSELLSLSDHVSKMYGFMDDVVDGVRADMRIESSGTKILQLPMTFKSIKSHLFWKHLITKEFHTYPSQRSISHFLERLEQVLSHKKSMSRIVLSKSLRVTCSVAVASLRSEFENIIPDS